MESNVKKVFREKRTLKAFDKIVKERLEHFLLNQHCQNTNLELKIGFQIKWKYFYKILIQIKYWLFQCYAFVYIISEYY